MKLSAINTKDGAERGAPLHLRHPALGHLLYDGAGATDLGELVDEAKAKPVQVICRGTESRSVQERAKRIARRSTKDGTVTDDKEAMQFVYSLVIGFENIQGPDGKPLEADDEGKRIFFEQSDNLVEQVIDFCKEREHFFRTPSPASG